VTVVAATQAASTSTGSKSVNQICRENVDGVLEIKVRSTGTQNSQIGSFGPQQQTQEAQGTGFEIDKNGDIATNAHVVSGASSITVQTNDGET
jgi:S1-C subfamily serine protease